MLKNKFLIYIVLVALAVTGCAKRGSITGGPKDTIPPFIIRSSPENMSTGFTGNQIRIDFNEYIKIKDVNKQLIISPPMNTAPDIVPTGSASKFITIKIKDTLQPNTTYSFNFGQSITDNNEGNPYSQFKFVFSTGTYIDSLTLNGRLRDAYNKETDDFVSVMLYEANEKFTDSTIYKEKPRYVTNTLDSVVDYSLQNLKKGKYYLVAIKDKNSNYKFDPKTDKIGFLPKPVSIPTDTLFALDLFTEVRPFKVLKPTQASQNKLFVPYEGDPSGMKATVKNGSQTLNSLLTKVADKDSLQLWIPRDVKADSLLVSAGKGDNMKDFTVKIKEVKAIDSLAIKPVQSGGLDFRDKFTLTSTTPLVNIDNSKISLIKKDSSAVAFTTKYDEYEQKLEFDFVKEEEQNYTFNLMPGALRDFYGKESDTLKYQLRTATYADYGNLRISLENVNRFPLILQITNAKGDVLAEHYSEKETQINFDAIKPDKYMLRVIYDDNKNREWDTGDYLLKRQPEEVIYYTNGKDDLIDVRANWDVEQPFNLGG
ncbi:MAG: Ig-like domain-containing protein [Flavobacterium sp.]